MLEQFIESHWTLLDIVISSNIGNRSVPEWLEISISILFFPDPISITRSREDDRVLANENYTQSREMFVITLIDRSDYSASSVSEIQEDRKKNELVTARVRSRMSTQTTSE
jgi:hypothetical protein